MIKLVLFWDIDGTLLTTGRAGIFAWEDSFQALAGRPLSLDSYPTAGLTDVEISVRLARLCHCEEDVVCPTKQSRTTSLDCFVAKSAPRNDDVIAMTAAQLLKGYEDRLADCLPRRQGQVLPGVVSLLQALQNKPWIYSFLLTGNTARGAAAKLSHYGLNHFFESGAFSDGLPDRPSIARRAMQMMEEKIGRDDSREYIVIGDTPHDISCGKAIGAKTLAVCTGGYDREALAKHEPWLVLDSLESLSLRGGRFLSDEAIQVI